MPSAALNSMSEYFSASALAELLTAASQPWSAAGPEKPMVTVSPGASLSLAAPAGALEPRSSDVSGVLLVQPAARRPMTPAAARSLAGRDVMMVRDMLVSLRGRGGAVWW